MTREFLKQFGLDDKAIDEILVGVDYEVQEALDEYKANLDRERTIVMHCKPVANFQSVEFDYPIKELEELPYMFDIFETIQSKLKEIGQEQIQYKDKEVKEEREEPATEKQKQIMDKFHIPYRYDVSKKRANELIKESMSR